MYVDDAVFFVDLTASMADDDILDVFAYLSRRGMGPSQRHVREDDVSTTSIVFTRPEEPKNVIDKLRRLE